MGMGEDLFMFPSQVCIFSAAADLSGASACKCVLEREDWSSPIFTNVIIWRLRDTFHQSLFLLPPGWHTEKFCVQLPLQQYGNQELPDVQAGFRKGRGTRDQIANIRWIIKKAREFQKNIYFCFIDYAKDFDCVDDNKPWKILKEMQIADLLPASWEIYMQVKGHWTWNNWLVPNWERSMSRLYIVTLLI